MINFRLKNIDEVIPFGEEPDLIMNWYALSDGELWLDFGGTKLFEFSDQAKNHFKDIDSGYNNYYIAQFLEDFSGIFGYISQSIPERFYKMTDNLDQFFDQVETALDTIESDEDGSEQVLFDLFKDVTSWVRNRFLCSEHITGGPEIYFFRFKDKMRIVWITDQKFNDKMELWKAPNGHFEMEYSLFVDKVKEFGERFFKDMMEQIQNGLEEDQGDLDLDEASLLEEHSERLREFREELKLLKNPPEDETDWNDLENLYDQMKKEIR